MVNEAFPTVRWSEDRFVNVKENASPFDGNIIYWSKRNLDRGSTAKVFKNQDYACNKCRVKFWDDERIHLDHVDGNHGNWKPKNLAVVYQSCHQELHHVA